MHEHKCKGCLIDSTHGKLQKKKDALLEFIFADDSLCLTVSAQNVNIMAYTLSHESMASIIANNDLLVINFKAKKQIKISAIGKTKLLELKTILDALIDNDLNAYHDRTKQFCQNSNNNSKINQSTTSNGLSESNTSKKSLKIDKMKAIINDENSHPVTVNPPKKNTLHSAANFYPNARNEYSRLIDENVEQISSPSRKRTSENQSSSSSIRFEHATNKTSSYFSQRTENKLKRNISNGESRLCPLSNIHSKPLNNHIRLWDNENENYAYDWRNSPYSTKKLDEQSSTDISLSKTVSTTMNLRKKGLKNIGATCYMNSILQCLLNIDPFRYDLMVTNSELITSSLLQDNTIYLCVLRILALLQDRQSTQSQNSTTTQLTDEERTVELQALSNLKKAVEKHSGNFFGSRQQDSHEFLNLVISLMTDEIDAIKCQINDEQTTNLTNPIIDPTTNNFQFCLATERSCEICGMSTIKTEIHTALLLHVTDEESKTTKTNSLPDLLDNYFGSESIDGCFCDHCQSNQRKFVKYRLEKLPRILIFYLKRWHITKNAQGELQSVSKEDHPVDCPLTIDVQPFCSNNTLQPCMIHYVEELPNLKELLKQREEYLEPIEAKRVKLDFDQSGNTEIYEDEQLIATHANYRLFALINHHGGSSDVGHYTSTVYDAKGDAWWTYDDTSVTSCTEERVLTNLAPDAYGVMYMHQDILKLFQPMVINAMQ